jgi:hypothetical protein
LLLAALITSNSRTKGILLSRGVISRPIDAKSLEDATSRRGTRDGVMIATEMRGAYQLGYRVGWAREALTSTR